MARTSNRKPPPAKKEAPTGAGNLPTGVAKDTAWWPTLKRTYKEFSEDNLGDWAAALTYYGLLALFPAIIALVSVVGLFADPKSATDTITDIVTRIGPESSASTFSGPIESITANRSTAGVGLVLGLVVAIWSASGYLGAFIRASNVIYETREGRPFWKLRPLQIGITLAMVMLLALMALGIVLTGPVVSAVAEPLGISSTAVSVWNVVKWPVIAAVFVGMIGLIYYASPNVKHRKLRWVTPGSVVALVAWAIASGLFGLYVANFGSYDKTYGSLAGMIVILMWLWITNMAILFGHELNAEIERNAEMAEGQPGAEREIQLEPREEPEPKQTV